MKTGFTAEFPLLPHQSFCMEVSQLSPSVLLSEKTQEGFSYAVNKKKREEKNPTTNQFLYSLNCTDILGTHWCHSLVKPLK